MSKINLNTLWMRLGLAITVALWACHMATAQEVRYNFMPGTDFAKYHTYKWVDTAGATHPNQIVDAQIKQSVDAQLASKALTRTDSGKADLYISYQVAVDKERQWNGFGGVRWGGIATATSSTIQVGAIAIDLYDPAEKQLVWTGSATKALDPSSNPQKNQKNLNNALAKVLKNYPPKYR